MKKKIIKYIIRLIIIITIIILYNVLTSPFDTKEEKLTKPIYKVAVKNTRGIKLLRILVDDRNDRKEISFIFKLKKERYDNDFTPEELQNLNMMVEQTIEFLSTEKGSKYKYDKISFCLFSGKGNHPTYVDCWIEWNDEEYYFSGVLAEFCSELYDFYVFQNVHEITIDGGNTSGINETKIDKFSELKNLKAIYFTYDIENSFIDWLYEKLKEILPECKLYEKGIEVYYE